MLPYNIEILVDDDFAIDYSSYTNKNFIPKGIENIYGNTAIIDSSYFEGKNFFKPLKEILSKLTEVYQENLEKIVSKFGKYKIKNSNSKVFSIEFDIDNSFDLKEIYVNIDSDVKDFYII